MSDTTVPNDVIYWIIPIMEEENIKRRFQGEFLDISLDDVWYCKKCKRFYHWGSDWILYTYHFLENISKEASAVDWDSTLNIYFCFNDFERAESANAYRKNNAFTYPRKVYGRTGVEQVFVLSDDKVKVYTIEEKVEIPRE